MRNRHLLDQRPIDRSSLEAYGNTASRDDPFPHTEATCSQLPDCAPQTIKPYQLLKNFQVRHGQQTFKQHAVRHEISAPRQDRGRIFVPYHPERLQHHVVVMGVFEPSRRSCFVVNAKRVDSGRSHLLCESTYGTIITISIHCSSNNDKAQRCLLCQTRFSKQTPGHSIYVERVDSGL